MKKNAGARFLAFLCAFSFIVAALIASVGTVVFDKSFYTGLYEEIHLAETENLDPQELEDSIFLMVDYVQGNRDDLNGTIHWIYGEQPTFNEKEIAHMKDVRALWLNARKVMIVLAILAILSLLILIWMKKKSAIAFWCRGYLLAAAAFSVVIAFLGIWMLSDFTSFWTSFHHLFFSNNLWLLNPQTDFMIVICPEVMFSKMITRILLRFGIVFVTALIISLLYVKRRAVIGFEQL